MSIHNLDKIFKPRSVAIIGAGEKEGTIGYSLVRNLIASKYQGKIFPVNPRHKFVKDIVYCPSVLDIAQPVDLAVIVTPIVKTPSIIRECVQAGVGGGIIISAGGKEIGKSGRQVEAEIKREADKGFFRIIGPNCMGIISAGEKLNASFVSRMPLPGRLAFISQSGAICSSILDLSIKNGIGFRYFVSIGSMLDVDFGDLINYLGRDPMVSSIVLYIENLTNIRKFMSAARAISRVKPIVVLKSGRSKAGARAASSHTGALAGEDAIYDAAFKRAGIIRANTIEELFDCAQLMAKQPLPSGHSLGILTNGGGPGVMAVDALSNLGIEPASLSRETIKKLDDVLPPFWSKANPIDILGDASPERWKQALQVCFSDNKLNAVVIIFVPQALTNAAAVAEAVAELLRGKPHPPVFAVWMGGEEVEQGRQILNNAGVPAYQTPERAITAFMYMYSYARNLEMLQEIPPKLSETLAFDQAQAKAIIDDAVKTEKTLLTELESKTLLKAYGIPINQTEASTSALGAVKTARKIGFPVVMKILSRQIVHKSDAGGVKLNLKSDKDVKEAFTKIMEDSHAYDPEAELLGVTIQPMINRPEYELILGSKRDADFGPVILFGMGGIMTEILKDRALALPPLNRLLAGRLIKNTRVYHILKGYRNRPPANLELLEEILIRLSQLVIDFPEIVELDINPVILEGDQACAVDARVVIKRSDVSSPHHLVISPYPSQYEMTTCAKDGLRLFIRPIKPEDASLLMDLFHILSRQSIYYRFMSPLKTLPRKMLALFTQIDYDRDMAMAAIDRNDLEEKMLGVGRLISDPGEATAEFAVLVGDPWQGMGIGAILLERLIAVAKERSMESLWGYVLSDNTRMLSLGRKLGFTISKIADAGEYKLIIDLKSLSSGI